MDNSNILVETKNLKKYFNLKQGLLHAVDDVSLKIEKGKTLGLVGESGCGKSTIGRLIIRLLEPTDGSVEFNGSDIQKESKAEMRNLRKSMQIIFQDPFSSLDPRKTISQAIEEPLRITNIEPNRRNRENKVLDIMETVGLSKRIVNYYPHELDGGRRQRVGIARALSVDPKFIVCDEPVSALDVSIQAQILNLMQELQAERDLTYLFITHDLSVVNHFSDDIAVMYLGKLVEKAPAEILFKNPMHPYTKALLSAIPVPKLGVKKERMILKGEITSPINPKAACRFANRCNFAMDICRSQEPELVEKEREHQISCFLYDN